MMRFVASAAAIAMMASPAAFAQGKGNANGGGNGGGNDNKSNGASQSAKPKGNGGGNTSRGNDRKSGGGKSTGKNGGNAQANRGNGGNGNADRGNRKTSNVRVDRGDQGNGVRGDIRGNGNDTQGNRGNGDRRNGAIVRGNAGNRGGNAGRNIRMLSRDGRDLDVGFALPQLRQSFARDVRVINGCPPGLAKKRNGCLPPGQARQSYRSYNPGFFGLRGIGGGDYFYDDGYLLSYNRGGIAGYLPLLGGALGIGNVWPSTYAAAPLPAYYSSYYGLPDQRGYRFADNVIYRVDPESAAIVSVAALLTGDDIGVGQPLPVGYDVYNVPYAYRDRYVDSPRARYRYVDGYIYEVDPETALVVSAIDLVT